MARKFGSSNRVGTGKIDSEEGGVEKWAGSVAAQVATAANVKEILVKTIPIAYVICDPENPRKLALTQTQVASIANKHPFNKALLSIEDPTEWIEDYVSTVGEAEGLTGKALGDLESLVSFAAALKSADRLLHPIVVWRDESTFHLIAGERRLFAHILLGEFNIAARIVEQGYNRTQIDTLQWEENVHREDMNLQERVELIRKIIEAGEGINSTSVTKLSKLIGRSRAECQRYLAVLRYPSAILLNAIHAGRVNDLKQAAALAQLSPLELENKISTPTQKAKPKSYIKFTSKQQVPQFGQIIKAAAKQLKMDNLLKETDLSSQTGVNDAIALLLAEIEEHQNG